MRRGEHVKRGLLFFVFSFDKTGLWLFLQVFYWLLPVCTYVSAPSSFLVNIVIAFIIMFGV